MILVTGGTGLVGSYLVLKLAKKAKHVKVLYRNNATRQEVYNLFKIHEPERYKVLYDSLQWIEGDILDITSLQNEFEGVTEVYHAAGKVSFNEKEKKLLNKINIEGTQNMINLSITNKIDKFCFFSSIATLDPNFDVSIINENAEWNFKRNHSSYACSKYGAEMEVWRGSQEGLKVLVVYPGIVIGSGNWERANKLLYEMTYADRAFYTSGSTAFIDASDLAEVCIRLMEDLINNDKYIVTARNVTYKEIICQLRSAFEMKPPIEITNSQLKKMAFWSQFLSSKKRISKSAYFALISQNKYSNDKLEQYLSYSFLSLEDSLNIHAKNYLQYKNNK
ncbi:NAD-dependent epimerase/dehydratase family protein [uncultured Apibacter sp.]|uniref:NAD-dependent epimerase/dehydratase family protein n=1 Tax=uncultured Apibacter sp. TaxID=1778616 RepID=UPI0025E9B3BD|nr:NAD-dependent epimerase/dehydratase family protein [uncultured Apibacter sp.]